jgi:hypothetical protein
MAFFNQTSFYLQVLKYKQQDVRLLFIGIILEFNLINNHKYQS